MTFDNIPEQMKAYPRWVVRKGKIPYNPNTGQCAKAAQPQTWGRYDEAIAALNTNQYSGLGFQFHKDGFVGVDFDNCIKGGVLDNWVTGWVESFNSYTEISPSGKGIHIICAGFLPDKAVKRPQAEMYDNGRYFTVTGDVLGAVRPLRAAQEAINALYEELTAQKQQKLVQASVSTITLDDNKLLKIAAKAKNGSTFTSLYSGNWQGLYQSQSEADVALCNILAFYTGKNAMQMDRIFRNSGLMRDKWNRKQSGSTYGAITIQNAIDCCQDVYSPRRSPQEAFCVSISKSETHLSDCIGSSINLGIVNMVLKELGITVKYNTLLKEIEIEGLPNQYSNNSASEILPVVLIDYLKLFKIKNTAAQNIKMYLKAVSDESRYNPLYELLNNTKWDSIDRLNEVYRILGMCEPKYQTYIRKWLIQCVALGLNSEENPVGAEGVLVLQGEQGLAKTSFFRILSPYPRWFVEGAVIDMKNKDSIINSVSGMLCELGELDNTLKREQSSLKAFITQPFDNIRMPYAEKATRSPRRTSFCGTVNPQDYLRDETGSRRFWTISVTKIDKQALFTLKREWVHQLWAQVYILYKENTNSFRLTESEMRTLQQDNQAFNIPLPYELEIIELFDLNLPIEKWEWWKSSDIAFRLGVKNDSRRIGKALTKIEKSGVLNNGVLNFSNPPNPPKLKRTYLGKSEYRLPIQKYGNFECLNSGLGG